MGDSQIPHVLTPDRRTLKDDVLIASEKFLFPAVFHYYSEPLVVTRAKDQYLYDSEGREYLDFFGGIVTISVGHCNDAVNARIHEQLDTLQHVSTVFATAPQAALAERIASITPNGALTRSFFTTSGTEANETAILAARCYTGATEVIALRHSYHGRSSLAMAMTGNAKWRLGGVTQPGIVHAHNAYCYRCPFGSSYPSCDLRCARDVRELIETTTSGRIAGMIAEPIQGVGGFITPPAEYFQIVSGIVREYGGVFISDEVQTGWGRTGGRWFGIEQYGVVPEIITGAKGLGNGTPIGVTVATDEVANAVKGLTISTFGGNPIAATAATAVLDYIEQHGLRDNAAETGAYLRSSLEELQLGHPFIGEVRGMGLLQAVELVRDRGTKEPAPELASRLLEIAKGKGLILGKGGLYGNVIRISPPMNISKADVQACIRMLDESLTELEQGVV